MAARGRKKKLNISKTNHLLDKHECGAMGTLVNNFSILQ
jgi:hypothetical protein